MILSIILVSLAACTPAAPETFVCPTRNANLTLMEAVVPFDEYSLSFNTSEEGSALTFWVQDPSLDAHNPVGLTDRLATALLEVSSVVHRFFLINDCISMQFDYVYVIIVDAEYLSWFSGTLASENIPNTQTLTEDELVTLATSYDIDSKLREALEPFIPPPDNACTWQETREKIALHFPATSDNIDFFYTFDALGNTVWAQFVGPADSDITAYIGPKVAEIIEELDCLYPQANKINTIVTDSEGEVVLVGTVTANLTSENAVNGFDINDYTFGLVGEDEGE